MTTYATLILAGGHSSRMHLPKPWLKNRAGQTFLGSIIELYNDCGIQNIKVVLNARFQLPPWESEADNIAKKADILLNHQPERGRMFSLQMGLNALKDVDFIYIHNVDNPFIQKDQIEMLKKHQLCGGVTAPAFNGKGGHPILVSQPVTNYILNQKDTDTTLKHVLAGFPKNKIEMNNPNVLINLNSEADYKKAMREFL